MIHALVGTLFITCRGGTQTPNSGSWGFRSKACTCNSNSHGLGCKMSRFWFSWEPELLPVWACTEIFVKEILTESQEIKEAAEKWVVVLLNFLVAPLEIKRQDPNENPPAANASSKVSQSHLGDTWGRAGFVQPGELSPCPLSILGMQFMGARTLWAPHQGVSPPRDARQRKRVYEK